MLGAGLMGAGVAMVAAQAGIEVVLLDRDVAAAEKGKAYTAERLAKKRTDPAKMEQILGRIHPTADYADLAGCDLIIEAVFEDRGIKAEVTKRVEAVVGADTIFGSNTSTLPITGLATAWSKPANFIGIHFFSPVEKMPLVEIIVGKETGPEAIAKALDFVAAIRKTPIVVNDSRGFYTSRCFGTYIQEGLALLSEGVAPALIENVGRHMGMPVGPLAVNDEVGLDLSLQGRQADQGRPRRRVPAERQRGRHRDDERPRPLWAQERQGLLRLPRRRREEVPVARTVGHRRREAGEPSDATPEAIRERLLYRQMVECARCFAEGVLETPQDGDLGAIFGWGFLPFTGGPFSHMDTIGLANVVAILDGLTQRHGERFAPPPAAARHGGEGRDVLRPGGGLKRRRSARCISTGGRQAPGDRSGRGDAPPRAAAHCRRALLVVAGAMYGAALAVPGRRRLRRRRPGWTAPPLRIVQLADLHYGPPDMSLARLARIVDQANALHPDLIALTGDYHGGKWIDLDSGNLDDAVRPLARLRSRLGTFAVRGNHDEPYWTPRVLPRYHMTYLENAHADAGPITVAGIDDLSTGHADIAAALAGHPARAAGPAPDARARQLSRRAAVGDADARRAHPRRAGQAAADRHAADQHGVRLCPRALRRGRADADRLVGHRHEQPADPLGRPAGDRVVTIHAP